MQAENLYKQENIVMYTTIAKELHTSEYRIPLNLCVIFLVPTDVKGYLHIHVKPYHGLSNL